MRNGAGRLEKPNTRPLLFPPQYAFCAIEKRGDEENTSMSDGKYLLHLIASNSFG